MAPSIHVRQGEARGRAGRRWCLRASPSRVIDLAEPHELVELMDGPDVARGAREGVGHEALGDHTLAPKPHPAEKAAVGDAGDAGGREEDLLRLDHILFGEDLARGRPQGGAPSSWLWGVRRIWRTPPSP